MDSEEKQNMYDRFFANIHIRAFRAMLMHYDEAHRYDAWAGGARWVSAIFCFTANGLDALSSYSSLSPENRSMWNLFSSFDINWRLFGHVLPFGLGVLILAGGFSYLFDTYAKRAQIHVHAGAEFTKIYRLAELYRRELHGMKPDAVTWPDQEGKYKELVDFYVNASTITVIQFSAYKRFSDEAVILEKYDERERLLNNFLRLERNEDTAHTA